MATQYELFAYDGFGSPYLDSLIGGSKWIDGPITYCFGPGTSWDPGTIAAFERARDNYEAVCNVHFQEVQNYATADMVFWQSPADVMPHLTLPDGEVVTASGLSQFPDKNPDNENLPGSQPGRLSVWDYFNMEDPTWANLNQGSYGYITVIHELGHSMGLYHPHDGGGVFTVYPTPFPGVEEKFDTGDFGLNQGIWTIMGYNDGYDQRPAVSDDYGWEGTLMAFDIAALQRLYGVNTEYHKNNDTYYLPTENKPGTFWSCIWDAGGNADTISNAWSDLACTIDLREATLQPEPGGGGFVSSVDGIVGGFTIANGAAIENAVGGAGDDTLIGNDYSNRLEGGAGDDTVVVGLGGSDILDGGTGSNTLSFALFTDDVKLDLASGYKAFPFTYPRASIAFSNFQNVTGGAGNDKITGDAQNNRLDGGGGSDTLDGGAGDDTFMVSRFGNDTFVGGKGSDTLSYERFSTDVTVNLADGSDVFRLSSRPIGLIHFSGIENVLGGAGNDTITGDTGSNRLDGGTGVDTLNGGGGDDTLLVTDEYNPFGRDVLNGGTGTNTLSFEKFTTNVEVALASGLYRSTVFSSMQNITGGASDDKITGDRNANVLVGGAGGDTIHGGGGSDIILGGFATRAAARGFDGDDTIYGDAGDDVITVLWGNDRIHGGEDNDTLSFAEVTPGLTLDLESGHVTYMESGASFDASGNPAGGFGGQFTVTWDGIENLTGGSGSDTITGDAKDNRLGGGAGADTFVFTRGWGKDTITDFKVGVDHLDMTGVAGLSGLGQLTITNTAQGAKITLGADTITLNGVTRAQLLASDSFTFDKPVLGTEGRDVLTGDGAANHLMGLGGDDTLIGKGGADILDGGTGVDTVDYSLSSAAVTVDLAKGIGQGGDAAGDTFVGIEQAIGSAFGDTFRGGTDRGQFLAGDGNDTMIGGSSYDWLEGGNGHDIFIGTGGFMVMFGGDGNDTMTGSLDSGNYFDGGAGDDVMRGGNTTDYMADMTGGSDTMRAGGGADTLVDFYGLTQLFGEDGDDFVTAAGGTGLLDGGEGKDYISVANGNYTLVGGAGDDTLEAAGTGAHIFTGGAGADTFTYRVGGDQMRIVTDFQDGVDHIHLWDNRYYGNVPLESLTIADSAAGAVISWNGGSQMVLTGIAASQLTHDDFVV